MSKVSKPFASLIEHEEKIRNTYRELAEKAAQSNIRYFLTLFLNSHNDIIEKLKAYGKRELEPEEQVIVEAPLSISATDHLVSEDNVDLSSLQSVLLYLAKTEAESVNEFDLLIKKTPEEEMKEYLERIKEEKEIITTKADRLYHDMIESKIS